MIQKIILSSFFSIFILLAGSSCNFETVDEEDERNIRIVYTDWSESIAITHLSSYLLEEKLGYAVILKLTDVESAYREVAKGESDVFPDAWLPKTQKMYYDKYADKLELIGITYPEARIGLVVPAYSSFDRIEDLKDYPESIIGIDSGAGVMIKTEKAISKYFPTKKLISLSEDIMVEHLEDSLQRRKDIVVTGWEPHWIFARHNVRILDDPDNVFGAKEKIYTIGRKGLQEDHPHAVRFFERMQLTEKQLNTLVYEVRMSEDPREGIKRWIKQNEYVVNQWVKDLQPVRKKIM